MRDWEPDSDITNIGELFVCSTSKKFIIDLHDKLQS